MRLSRFLAPIACLAAAVSVMFAAPANAAAQAPPATEIVTVPMQIVGYDKDVAAANGYEIRTAADGTQYSVKISDSGTVAPLNVVTGNCGYSFIYEYGIGNRAVELYTGFSVIRPVVSFAWRVRLDDRGGSSYKGWSGGARANGIWQVDVVIGGLTRGGARATVIGPSSFAVLDNGAVCYSGGPFDDTTIT